MSGWICSYRDIWSHPFFKGNGMRVAVWHWLLHHTAWQDCTHKVTGADITVRRGEVCFTQQQISDATGATRKQVREVLEYLTRVGSASKIGAKERANGGASVRANAKSLYAIVNYDKYQARGSEGANGGAKVTATKGPTKEQENNYNKKQEETPLPPKGEDAGFQAFWDAYPHRPGAKKNRKGALAKWSAAIKRGVTADTLMTGVERMKADPAVVRGFARDAVTWLNQEGWTDEVAAAQPGLRVVGNGPRIGDVRMISGAPMEYAGNGTGWIRVHA